MRDDLLPRPTLRQRFCTYLNSCFSPSLEDRKSTGPFLNNGRIAGLAFFSLAAVSIGVTSISVVGDTFVGKAAVLKSLANYFLIPAGTFIYSFLLSLDRFSTTPENFQRGALPTFLLSSCSMMVTASLSVDLFGITTSFLKQNEYAVPSIIFVGPIIAGMIGLILTRVRSITRTENSYPGFLFRVLENLCPNDFCHNCNDSRVVISLSMVAIPAILTGFRSNTDGVDLCLLWLTTGLYFLAKPLAEAFTLYQSDQYLEEIENLTTPSLENPSINGTRIDQDGSLPFYLRGSGSSQSSYTTITPNPSNSSGFSPVASNIYSSFPVREEKKKSGNHQITPTKF